MIAGILKKLKNDARRPLHFLVHCKQPLKLAEPEEVLEN
jgi:hypothetical protein